MKCWMAMQAILPPVIIQIPVYLEDLEDTIMPTLHSVKAALMHYQQAGGTAKIFINDDGLQVCVCGSDLVFKTN